MNAQPIRSQFASLFSRNGTGYQKQEPFPGPAQEPEATKTGQEIGDAPISPAKPAKASRRRYSLEEKRRILRLVDACTEHGQVGALLRREGLYYSSLRLFQQQREKGLLDAPSRPANKGQDAHRETLEKQIAQLQRENCRLADKLEKAQIVIDFQKKLSRLLEVETPTPDQADPSGPNS